jgi:hypothetical protein
VWASEVVGMHTLSRQYTHLKFVRARGTAPREPEEVLDTGSTTVLTRTPWPSPQPRTSSLRCGCHKKRTLQWRRRRRRRRRGGRWRRRRRSKRKRRWET